MTNEPKILSNDLDQISKTWEWYEKELNNPEVHNQIIETFDKYDGLSGLFNLSVEDLKNIDIHQLKISMDKEMESFYWEWNRFWEWRKFSSKKEYPDERDRDNEIRRRYYVIKNKREKKRVLNGTPNIQNEYLGNTVGNLFQTFEDAIQRDYCNITNIPFEKKLSFKWNFMRFRIASGLEIFREPNSEKITNFIKNIEQYINVYNYKLELLKKTIDKEPENLKNDKKYAYLKWLRPHYVEAVLVCKILVDIAKSHKDADNEILLKNWLQELLSEIANIDAMKK